MAVKNSYQYEEFVNLFLKFYLSNGIGSMSKSDIDALVMHLLDNYSTHFGTPLKGMTNYEVSNQLKASVTKIKKLRYDAGLKYSEKNYDEAMIRFANALQNASFNLSDQKINLIIEDQLAKNWIQGTIKKSGLVFDNSFNSEIIKIDAEDLLNVMSGFFNKKEMELFHKKLSKIKNENQIEDIKNGTLSLVKEIATNLVTSAIPAISLGLLR